MGQNNKFNYIGKEIINMVKLVNAFKKKRNLGFVLSKRNRPELDSAQLRGRFPKTYARFGKAFLSSFPTKFFKGPGGTFAIDLRRTNWESPLQISLITNRNHRIGISNRFKEYTDVEAFNIKLDFRQGKVKIVGIQGGFNSSKYIQEFEAMIGMPIAVFLVKQIEEHAKKQGYKKVEIIRPENNIHIDSTFLAQLERIMRRTSRGKYLIDKQTKANQTRLKKKDKVVLTEKEKEELESLKNSAREKLIEQRKKMYTKTAKALGYSVGKNWFVKTLN